MTREEAIARIKDHKNIHKMNEPRAIYITEAFDMAIKALEQEPCEDVISRQAVLDIINNPLNIRLDEIIKKLPPVIPQKTGHWINKDGQEHGFDIGGVKTWYIQIMCSECGFIKTAIEGHTGQYHYCPNCGAKMQEVQE